MAARLLLPLLIATAVAVATATRPIDGRGTNPAHPQWGVAGAPQFRLAPRAPPSTLPSARAISNAVCAAPDGRSPVDPAGANVLLMTWGQFVDHDIVMTPTESDRSEESTDLGPCPRDIAVPRGDPVFDPQQWGNQTLPFTCSSRPLVNAITAWLDGSGVYGSRDAAAALLRDPATGRMRTAADNDRLLPLLSEYTANEQATLGMANAAQRHPTARLRAAGDVRANENPLLLAMHTLFVREHNRIVDTELAAAADMSPLDRWAEARRRVVALIQHITVNEYLPHMLGAPLDAVGPPLPPHVASPSEHGPTVSLEFSTAIYRYGHTQIAPSVHIMRSASSGAGGGGMTDVPLRDLFFGAFDDVDAVLEGARRTPAHAVDTIVVEEARSFLFGNGSAVAGRPGMGAGGTDLASLNLQRGRDHGLPSYGQLRATLGLEPAVRPEVAAHPGIRAVYGPAAADRGDIDLWIGALAEQPRQPGARLGELAAVVVADQFRRIRDADPRWAAADQEGGGDTLLDVIRRNTREGRARASAAPGGSEDDANAFDMMYDGEPCDGGSSGGVAKGWRVWGITAIPLLSVATMVLVVLAASRTKDNRRPASASRRL